MFLLAHVLYIMFKNISEHQFKLETLGNFYIYDQIDSVFQLNKWVMLYQISLKNFSIDDGSKLVV